MSYGRNDTPSVKNLRFLPAPSEREPRALPRQSTQSLREELKAYGGAYMRFEEPYIPDIRASLPPLAVGDILTLSIQAINYDGKILTATLETLTVTE